MKVAEIMARPLFMRLFFAASTLKSPVNRGAPRYNRVKPRKKTLQAVDEAQPKNERGAMLDPYSREPLKIGRTDLGHTPEHTWEKRRQMHIENKATRKQVIEAENNPDLYHWEDSSMNRGRTRDQK
ncbi:GH-E family nuclease [Duganella sp. Root336D2]|uniref:GH-E family nuclease n=1 Tax=Duganella sp. Root336D2 TaxID=1736518 RepID=UPI0009E9A708|nr:GH-E family nuclease [Duganella sp. Root336D2]